MTWSVGTPRESRKYRYRNPDLQRDGIYRETRLPYQFAWTSMNGCYTPTLGPQVWTALGKPTPLCVVCLQPMWRDTCSEDEVQQEQMDAAIAAVQAEMNG